MVASVLLASDPVLPLSDLQGLLCRGLLGFGDCGGLRLF